MQNNLIRLKVIGISYSQTHRPGAYALILAEENGERRVPIIIGGFEAQAIVIKLRISRTAQATDTRSFQELCRSMRRDGRAGTDQ